MRIACMISAAIISLSMMCAALAAEAPSSVKEFARAIPVAYDVDVVVVGGSSGAVAAAAAAAEAGAKVFLAAPRPYLGEDLCATMRLWLDEGETPSHPLARKLFSPDITSKTAVPLNVRSLPFKYDSSVKAAGKHPDPSLSRLSDGEVGMSNKDSVEYDDDVTITASLESPQEVREVQVIAFYRAGDFELGAVALQTSDDKKNWKDAGALMIGQASDEIQVASVAANLKARHFRFTIKRAAGLSRILLGEIALVPASQAPAPILAQPAPSAAFRGPVRPMRVKKELDGALLAAKVNFLYSCYVTDVLRDAQGALCGVVMANRAGRQAVIAKVIIDATDRASVARMAGAEFQPYPKGPQPFTRIVAGGEVRTTEGAVARATGLGYQGDAKSGPIELVEYALTIPMADGSFASFAKAEQIFRDKTYGETIQADTDEIFQVPPDAMKGAVSAKGEWKGAGALDLGVFRPAGAARLYALSGCADVPRDQAAKLLRPIAYIEAGARVGAAAAAEAKSLSAVKEAKVAPSKIAEGAPAPAGDVKEILNGVRPTQQNLPTIPSPERSLPVLGVYDVVVIGGGTSGAPAGIGAARSGAKTLVVEYLHGLGGVGTMGLISTYYHGYRGGFTKEVPGGNTWNPRQRAEWWRRTLRQAGAEIWFGALGCGAFVEGKQVKGVVVATPEGRGVILAKTVIDSTGAADVAAAAGAKTVNTNANELAVQGTGLPPVKLGARYTNTDFTITDETDMMDVWNLFVYAKEKYATAFDMGQLIDTRERRRIVGDFTMTALDQISNRVYPDTIHVAQSNFDSHGYTVDPYFMLEHPDKKSITANMPYRCLLPQGMDGMLVTGLAVSVQRDALPVVRMQPDLQNQGYAAGMAAAMSAKSGKDLRAIDIRGLQKQLVGLGIIPESALTDKDTYPMPAPKIAEAVANAKDDYKGASVIMQQPKEAMPFLKEAYKNAPNDKEKLIYAHILGVLGERDGVPTLISALDVAKEWDKGWKYTGMGQFGFSLSRMDTYIVALGRAQDKRGVAAILKKAESLDSNSEFSHFRAVALALEAIGDKPAAGALAVLLNKPGMRGHAATDPKKAAEQSGANPNDNNARNASLRELFLARALYHCGDKDGLGKQILTEYSKDLRGHWARHAQSVLDGQ
ncbi:MAG: FAD-dependent oxidoreductase [Candidatus Sumerlaeota bacterium]|nr:FAD-dependent oxidoreductase [Candidatus Sumerlaeota bacterium]